MKKLSLTLLIMILVLSLSACAAGTVEQTQPPCATENVNQSSFIPQPDAEVAVPQADTAAMMEFSLLQDGAALTLGVQQGAFPWDTDLTVAFRELWSGDGFDCFRIVTQEGLTVAGLRQPGNEDEQNGTILSLIAIDPAFSTYRGVSVGMSEEELLALYPEALRQDWPGTVESGSKAGDIAYDYRYVTPENADNSTRAILFGITGGQVAVIMLADGMDGRPF